MSSSNILHLSLPIIPVLFKLPTVQYFISGQNTSRFTVISFVRRFCPKFFFSHIFHPTINWQRNSKNPYLSLAMIFSLPNCCFVQLRINLRGTVERMIQLNGQAQPRAQHHRGIKPSRLNNIPCGYSTGQTYCIGLGHLYKYLYISFYSC